MRIPPFEPTIRPRWLRFLGIVGLGLVVTFVVWWPMFRNYPGTPIEDGHYFFHQIEISKAAVRRFHELPLWNPFDCKGIPMWDHPENITASPIFFLTLPFSAGITVIVWHVAHVVVGFLGMWLLCRDDLGLTRAATFLAAFAWSFGTVHNQYAGEHMAFISFYHAPLLLFAWRRAEASWDWAVGTGLLLALMVYDGATYPLPLTLVFLGIETLTRFTSKKRIVRLVAVGAVVGLVLFTVSAARLLPLQAQLGSHDRVMIYEDVDHLARLRTWADMYLLRSSAWRAHVTGQQYVLGEYHAYIGWLGLLLVVVGIAASAAETWWLIAICAALIVLMLGHFAPWAPWTFLHAYVPPFKSMRVPARFRLLLAMPVALFMAYAVDRAPSQVRSLLGRSSLAAAARVALLCLGIFGAGDSAGLFTEILEYRFVDAPPANVVASTRFYYGGSDLSPDFANHPRQNHAWLGCRAAWAYTANAAVWPGDVPQAKASDGAVVEVANRTHNTFTIDVDVKRPARIRLNSGYDRSWRSNIGTVVEDNQLLAIDLPVGHHRVFVRYWPQHFTLGIVISLLGLLGVVAFFLRDHLRAWRRAQMESSKGA